MYFSFYFILTVKKKKEKKKTKRIGNIMPGSQVEKKLITTQNLSIKMQQCKDKRFSFLFLNQNMFGDFNVIEHLLKHV